MGELVTGIGEIGRNRIKPTFSTSKCSKHREYNWKKRRKGSHSNNNLTIGKIRMNLSLEYKHITVLRGENMNICKKQKY